MHDDVILNTEYEKSLRSGVFFKWCMLLGLRPGDLVSRPAWAAYQKVISNKQLHRKVKPVLDFFLL